MKFQGYDIYTDTFFMIKNILLDSVKVHLQGVPKIKAKNLKETAKIVLRKNLKNNKVLYAGWGHYKLMWLADLGVAFKGLSLACNHNNLKSILEHILKISLENNKIFSCYSLKKGSDIPYERADSLPWLIYCLYQYEVITKDKNLVKKYRNFLQEQIINFELKYLDSEGIIKNNVTGDWIDTIKRPSSTWNNLCTLKLLYLSRKLNFKTKFNPVEIEKKLLQKRIFKNYLTDYSGSKDASVDGSALALYFKIFSKKIRSLIYKKMEGLDIFDPCLARASIINYPASFKPILTRLTAEGFHQTARWPHLGLMILNGLKNIGTERKDYFMKINSVMLKHSNFLETVDRKGNILTTLLTSEYGFSMTAGQYLEYVNS